MNKLYFGEYLEVLRELLRMEFKVNLPTHLFKTRQHTFLILTN